MHSARALILDVAHRALLLRAPDESLHAPATVARLGERALVAMVAFARERLELQLPHPSGARPFGDPHDFVFVLPPDARLDADGTRWVPMRDLGEITRDADVLWALYADTMLGGWTPPTRAIDVFAFGQVARDAANLAHLVVKGTKRATAGWIAAEQARKNVIPVVGMVSLVTDAFGFPICAIETERVDHVRFAEVPEDFARDEGEGDGTLADFREGHLEFFGRQAKELGMAFDDDALLFLERFRVLRVFQRA